MIKIESYFSKIAKVERIVFYITVITISILLSASYFLPMADLPQHAGQVAILKSFIVGDTSAPWFDDITINYFTTYWIAYFLAVVLSFMMPVNYAVNTVVGLAFLLFVLSFSLLRKKFNGTNTLDWILLPCFFGFSYIWGFITFILAIPIGVWLIYENLKLLECRNNKSNIKILLLGILLYFSHILVFLFCCLIASLMTLVNKDSIKEKIKQLKPFYILALLIPLFFLNSDFFTTNGLGQYFDANYQNYYYGLMDVRLYRLQLYPWTIYNDLKVPLDVFTIVFFILPFFMGCKLTKDLKRYVPLVIFLLAWFLFPEQAAKTSFIYHRFAIFLFPFYILIFERKTDKFNNIEIKPIFVCSCIWIGISLFILRLPIVDLIDFNNEVNGFKSLLDKTPEKKRVLSLVYDPSSDENARRTDVYISFPSWYQALKGGWVDFNFAWFPPQVIRYKVDKIPEDRPGFVWNPEKFIKFKNCNRYDFIFVRVAVKEQRQMHENLMKQSTCDHKFVYQSDLWFIYSR